jgi:hypothetical protein
LAGIVALALWCSCPNILGHGALITPDVGTTALALAACYTFWRWLKEPTWWRTLGSGLVLGLAGLAKTTLVVFYPLWVVMWAVYRWAEWRERKPSPCPLPKGEGKKNALSSRGARWLNSWWARELAMLAVRMAIAVYLINLGYGFEGSLTRLGDYRFVSKALGAEEGAEKPRPDDGNRFADSWLARLPVPLPKNYVLGIDLQKRDFENYHSPSYLRGEFREKGWWYYYLYALAIKVPLGTWVLVGLAALAGVLRSRLAPRDDSGASADAPSRLTGDQASAQFSQTFRGAKGLQRRLRWRDEFVLLAPAVVILVFVSSQTGFSEHMRYVLPCFPFVFVWIGRVAFVFSPKWWGSSHLAPQDEMRGPAGQDAFRHRAVQGAGDDRLAKVSWWRRNPDFILRSKMTTFGRRAVTGIAAAALAWSIGSSLWV